VKIAGESQQLLDLAGSAVYARGQAYAASGRVIDLIWEEPMLIAEVAGSEDQPYETEVYLGREGDNWLPATCECTCLYDGGLWCKHAVAVLLEASKQSDQILARIPVSQQIEAMSVEDLRLVLLTLAKTSGIRKIVAAAMASVVEPKASMQLGMLGKETRRKVQQMARQATGWEDYGAMTTLLSNLEGIVNQADQMAADGRVQEASTVLTALLDEFFAVWEEFDDESDQSQGFLDRVARVWIEIILGGQLEPARSAKLSEDVERWDQAAQNLEVSSLDPVFIALDHGYDLQALSQEDAERWRHGGTAVAEVWLEMLKRAGDDAEYLAYSSAVGLDRRHVLFLIERSRIREALDYADQMQLAGRDALEVLFALKQVNAWAEALEYGRAAWVRSPDDGQLAVAVAEIAEQVGNEPSLLALHLSAWQVSPNFKRYQRIKTLAGDHWPRVAPSILREVRAEYGNDDTMRILLAENEIDAVTEHLALNRWVSDQMLAEVAKALIVTRPTWVIQHFTARASAVADAMRSDQYRSAATWLSWVRDAYRVLDREDAWQAEKNRWMAKHRQKRSLMPLLRAL